MSLPPAQSLVCSLWHISGEPLRKGRTWRRTPSTFSSPLPQPLSVFGLCDCFGARRGRDRCHHIWVRVQNMTSRVSHTSKTSICRLWPLLCIAVVPVLAQEQPQQIPLSPNGAPGFESRRGEPELAKDYWVRNINNPSITVYLPPKEKATGAAVICPGGGHRLLV